MNRSRVKTAVWAGLLILGAATQALAAESSTRPPTKLKLVGDHWTPWDPPEVAPNAYIIQKGDTLWDLSGKFLGNPFLWPQIWDQNRYILDSHWIYPGDPLVIPGKPTVVPAEGPEEGTEAPPEEEAEGPAPEEPREAVPAAPALVPVADASDLYCSGFIEPSHTRSEVWIVGREMENEHQSTGDVVYINQGSNQGIKAGDKYLVVRPVHPVVHPATEQSLGMMVRRLGWLRVLLAQENTATAVIEMACEDIRIGDELVAWAPIVSPLRSSIPVFDRYNATPSGGPSGQVVASDHDLTTLGKGHIVFTDLGEASGVKPGDVLTVYRDQVDLPRANVGQAVVLTVEPGTSTVKLMLTVREAWIGDRVEVVR